MLKDFIDGLLGKKAKKVVQYESIVGVSITDDSIGIAHVQGNEPGSIVVKAHDFQHSRDPELKLRALTDFVQKNGLEGLPCCVVLRPEDYVLGLIEKPNVDPSEMSEAVRWAVKEFIDYPVEEAIVDAFELPLVRASDNVKMAYAAVAHNRAMPEIEKLVTGAGLMLRYIDIQELCLRNVSMLHPENEKGCLFIRMYRDGGNIVLTRKEELFVYRKMDIDLHSFVLSEEYLEKEISDDDETLDHLTLDVQRSMDYCSSMFRHSPATSIVISPSEIDVAVVEAYLAKNLGLPTFAMDLSECMWFEQEITKEQQKDCLLAIGAGLHNISPGESA